MYTNLQIATNNSWYERGSPCGEPLPPNLILLL